MPRCHASNVPVTSLMHVRARREELVALGERLHHRVLDAVVDHLRVVAGAGVAHVDEALLARTLGAQRVEDRHRALDLLAGPPTIRP